jgi:pyocin large subunit-like protein
MTTRARLALVLVLLGVVLGAGKPSVVAAGDAPTTTERHASTVGFRSRSLLIEHYKKHGSEFGKVTQTEYLRLAQTLRDQPMSDDVLEAKRADGVITRFERSTGAFIAFNRDRTIRTFFKPSDGEAYFLRQARRDAPPPDRPPERR